MMKFQKIINALTTYYNCCKIRWGGGKIGYHPRFCGSVSIQLDKDSKLSIGNNVIVAGGMFINPLGCQRGSCVRVNKGAILTIGDNCGFSDVSIWAHSSITFGDNVTVGAGCIINDSNNHPLDYRERRKERECKNRDLLPITHRPIVIEDDVFIGACCIISKGVSIGARSIIAAGSVVVKNIPPDEMWGGNPAKFIRKLNVIVNNDE